jgi:formylglycine-generating enzyme required for sulfatase activity
VPLVRAIRQRRRPQFSLRWLILLVVVLGMAQYGGFRWWRAAEAQKDFFPGESPAHEVTLSTPYYIGKFEMTREQYQQVMGTNPSHFKGRDLPVEQVSWDDAQEFCKKASEKMVLTVRLPYEAEWEHACRAGTRTTYYTGDGEADLDRAGWYLRNSSGTTHPVGQKTPNVWGLYDMHGNVWEWCADWYMQYGTWAMTDPQGPAKGQYRVQRGGCGEGNPRYCRSAPRYWLNPDGRNRSIGFRVAAAVPPKAP